MKVDCDAMKDDDIDSNDETLSDAVAREQQYDKEAAAAANTLRADRLLVNYLLQSGYVDT